MVADPRRPNATSAARSATLRGLAPRQPPVVAVDTVVEGLAAAALARHAFRVVGSATCPAIACRVPSAITAMERDTFRRIAHNLNDGLVTLAALRVTFLVTAPAGTPDFPTASGEMCLVSDLVSS